MRDQRRSSTDCDKDAVLHSAYLLSANSTLMKNTTNLHNKTEILPKKYSNIKRPPLTRIEKSSDTIESVHRRMRGVEEEELEEEEATKEEKAPKEEEEEEEEIATKELEEERESTIIHVPGTSLIIKFDTILKNMIDQFKSEEFSRSSLTTWNLLTLESIKEKNPGKTTSECFDILSTQIRELRYSIPFELRHEKTSIVNYEHAHPTTSTTFYTNRKFRSDSDKGQAYGEKGDSKGRFRIQGEKKMNTLDKEGNAKKCWVYNATDHMSFDHTVEEREKAKEKFKAKNSSKFKGNFGRSTKNTCGTDLSKRS
ncbi:hypothetical protein WAI453_006904 [Rhynchosporium graminicola]